MSFTSLPLLTSSSIPPSIFLSSATSDAYPLEKTLGVLKLSTKYQIEYLRYQALRLLCADHVPLTFDAFDHKGTKWSKSTTTAMKILPVARQCNAIWLLPTLFYLSCALPTDETHDPDEFTQADIDLMDERRIWRGRSLLIQANNREICAPLRMPCDSMELDCSNSKIDLLDSWLDGCPLEFIAWKPTGLCANCLPLMKQEVETAKRRFWHSIPYLFDLPPWEELRKQQDIDLGYAPGAQTVSLTFLQPTSTSLNLFTPGRSKLKRVAKYPRSDATALGFLL